MRLASVLVLLLLLPAPLAPAAPLDDDAGSGGDAPETLVDLVRILPGRIYEGNLSGLDDLRDAYAFEARAGDLLDAKAVGVLGCLRLHAPDGGPREATCVAGNVDLGRLVARLDRDGVWFLDYAYVEPQPYRFAFALNGEAPHPTVPTVAPLARTSWIQPGAQVSTPAGSCTLNFVYDGTGSKAGKVYIGTAAHCFTALGQPASTGTHPGFGKVVYLGDYGGINTGSFSNGIPGAQTDFALIEVDPAFHAFVRAEVKGRPGLPAGGTFPRADASLGDRLDFSGYGIVWSTTAPTREMRSGFYTLSSGNNWNAVAPILSGDSGGPVLHQDGRAFGVATHLSLLGAGGPFLEVSLQEAQAAGFPVQLRTAA